MTEIIMRAERQEITQKHKSNEQLPVFIGSVTELCSILSSTPPVYKLTSNSILQIKSIYILDWIWPASLNSSSLMLHIFHFP